MASRETIAKLHRLESAEKGSVNNRSIPAAETPPPPPAREYGAVRARFNVADGPFAAEAARMAGRGQPDPLQGRTAAIAVEIAQDGSYSIPTAELAKLELHPATVDLRRPG
jgi:hypothetical protein